MTSLEKSKLPSALTPLPFHEAIRASLKELEPGLWSWFSSDNFGKKYADDVRLELLRSTYRIPPEGQVTYAIAEEIRDALGLSVPLTLYQAQEDGRMNAALIFVPGEIHVVFRGPIQTKLKESELRALLGHEIAHYKLWTDAAGEFQTAAILIEDIASTGSAPSFVQSAIRFRLWTEIYADRAGLLASDDLASAIACLVKVGTGLDHVDGLAYLEQATEAIGTADTKSAAQSHPETFVRAFALKSWATNGDFALVEKLVEGAVEIDALDLVQQRALTKTTEALVNAILARPLMQTEATLAHARRFFTDLSPHADEELHLDFSKSSESVTEYLAYVLLDFAMIDHEIEDVALAHAASLAVDIGIQTSFRKIAKKELKISVAALADLEARGHALLAAESKIAGAKMDSNPRMQ